MILVARPPPPPPFHVLIKPPKPLPQPLLHRLLPPPPPSFPRPEPPPHPPPRAPDHPVPAVGLNRKRAVVIVRLAVDQQDRRLDLVGIHERRHPEVHVRRFP